MSKPYTVTRSHQRTLVIRDNGVGPGWERRFLLGSDVHYDHPDCNRKKFFKHLSQARELNTGVFLFGDAICGMQGKDDRRASKDALDLEYTGSDYSDRLVDVTASHWKEYWEWIELLSIGNHEGAWLNHHERNITRALAERIGCEWMGYSGYIKFNFEKPSGGGRTSRLLYFHHGRGGSAEVTRGTIKTNRRSVYQVSPDIIVSGDIHQKWVMHTPRYIMSSSGKPYQMDRVHIQLGTYKVPQLDEDALAWSDEKEMAPVLEGGYWLIFRYDRDYPGNVSVSYEPAM